MRIKRLSSIRCSRWKIKPFVQQVIWWIKWRERKTFKKCPRSTDKLCPKINSSANISSMSGFLYCTDFVVSSPVRLLFSQWWCTLCNLSSALKFTPTPETMNEFCGVMVKHYLAFSLDSQCWYLIRRLFCVIYRFLLFHISWTFIYCLH